MRGDGDGLVQRAGYLQGGGDLQLPGRGQMGGRGRPQPGQALPGPLAERGIRLSSSQVYRLVTGRPERLSLKVLMALLLVQWLGPRDLALTIERYDTRDGGKWRYINTDAQGNTYGFHGVFHGDPSPDAIVQTFEFEAAPGHVKLDTTTLEQRGGKTLVALPGRDS